MGECDTLVGIRGEPLATWKSSKGSLKTNWESVARAAGATAAQIAANTTMSEGTRRFLSKIKI
jgi:hypothetical protein